MMRKNPDYLTLYKDSERSVSVHAVDAAAWLEQGWNIAEAKARNVTDAARAPSELPVTLATAESLSKQPARKKVADA